MKDSNAVVAVFENHEQAERAIKEIERSGFEMKRLSIVGRGYHSEEQPTGFYSTGDRMKAWGGVGAFWGGLWGMLVGAAFFWIPGLGPLVVAGPFVSVLVGAIEGATLVGGLSALGAALAGLGVPHNSIVKYEKHIKADRYLLIAHGAREDVKRARAALEHSEATEAEVFAG